VVVWLEGVAATPPPAEDPAVLDQRNLQFVPHVLAVPAGTRVRMPNSDRVFHNVFSFHDGKRFDLGLYPVGTTRAVTFDRPGLSRIFCNIHPNMAAYVLAVDSAYVAVTDRHGRFAIAGVPPGTTWRAWRPVITPQPGRSPSSRAARWRSGGHEARSGGAHGLVLAARWNGQRAGPGRRAHAERRHLV
jgi:plastocyanin